MRWLIALLAGAATGLCSIPRAETLYVSPDGTGEYATIQAAVDAAVDGDVILLGSGVFRGDGNRDVQIVDLDLTVASESSDPQDCVIDCEGNEGDPHRAISLTYGSFLITGVSMINGNAGVGAGGGGAMQVFGGNATLSNCVFARNTAVAGGALTSGNANTTIAGCTFYANTATDEEMGSAVFLGLIGSLNMDHCIMSFGGGGGAVGSAAWVVQLNCCDVFGNEGGDYVGHIAGQLGLNGNISEDPLFCDPVNLDLRVHSDSPCAPDGDCGLIGALPVGCGPTAVERGTWGAIKALYRGE